MPGYDFRAEGKQLTVVDTFGAFGELSHIKCAACEKRLPEDQFECVARTLRQNRPLSVLHPHCHKCRQRDRAAAMSSPLYSPKLDKYFAKRFWGLKSGARARGIMWALDERDLVNLYVKQNGRCALTGLEMKYTGKGYASRGGADYGAPSCDRINSSGNYVLGNVHLVLLAVNRMKNDLPQDIFIQLCERVVAHQLTGSIAA